MGTKGWTRDLVVRCLTDAAVLWQGGEWQVGPADRAAARASGLTGPAAYGYAAAGDVAAGRSPWLHRAAGLVGLAEPLRVAAGLPDRGPLPMLLTATADLCDELRPVVNQLQARWDADRPEDVGVWELAAVSDDVWRMTDEVEAVVHRLARFLGSMLVTG